MAPDTLSGMTSMILVTIMTALAAYGGNLLLFRWLGRRAATAAVPWWEEGCKLAAASRLPAVPLWAVYALFGLVELAYDIWQGQRRGALLGTLALGGHAMTALAAGWIISHGGGLWLSWAVTGLLHSLWNRFTLQMLLPLFDATVMDRARGT